jgi:predicted alpha/beta hydrolase family esterase
MPRDRSLGRTPRKQLDAGGRKKKKVNKKERILYLPNLDESVTSKSSKAAYLINNYHNVRIVDLRTSVWRIFLTSNECLTFASIVILSILLWYSDFFYLPGLLMFPSSFFLWREWPKLVSRTWYKLMTTCLQITRQEMFDFNPTIVVGSSFGGAVSVFFLLDNLQHSVKPLVLLAPIHAELNRQMVFDWHGSRQLPEKANIIIAHGDRDKRVKLSDSQKLEAGAPKRCKLYVIKNEGNRLNSLIGKGPVESNVSLVDLIEEAVAKR